MRTRAVLMVGAAMLMAAACATTAAVPPSVGTFTVNAAGTEMSGWVNGLDQVKITLRKQP